MPWCTRNSKQYYYWSVRINGQVHKRYIGTGALANSAAKLMEKANAARRKERERARGEAERFTEAFRQLRDLVRLCDQVVAAAFTAAGYHRHDRGPWRRRRMTAASIANGDEMGPAKPTLDTRDIIERAKKGDPTALPLLEKALDLEPAVAESLGNLSGVVERCWIQTLTGKNDAATAGMERRLKKMRTELGAEGASTLERAVIDRVVCSWLAMSVADFKLTTVVEEKTLATTYGRAVLLWQQQANAQFLAATKSLAMVRQFLRPRSPLLDLLERGAEGGPSPVPLIRHAIADGQNSSGEELS